MLRDALIEISSNYLAAKAEAIAGHPLAYYVRHTAPEEVRSSLVGEKIMFSGSPGGSGKWTHVPWIGIFDPIVTTGAQYGYYLVYLFSTDMERVYLSANQGTHEISQELGQTNAALAELRTRAERMRNRVPEYKLRFGLTSIDLVAKTYFPRGYEAGHAFGISYQTNNLPANEALVDDLRDGLALYRRLITRGGVAPLVEPGSDDPNLQKRSLTERRRYVAHRSIERNPRAAKEAKEIHGYVCQACEFDFEATYGELGQQYIEAHHLIPLASIPEGEEIPIDPKDDFAVLCSNCHRMVHRSDDVLTIAELRSVLGNA